MKIIRPYIILFLMVSATYVSATHIRAGEITAKKIGSLQYEFSVILYRNTEGVQMDSVELFFGDNTSQTKYWNSREDIGNKTEKYVFKFSKTYSAVGYFKAYIVHRNRNAGINNIDNGNSGEVNFYVETMVVIAPSLGQNSSPELLVPPIDQASKNKIFKHNPGAWDADGDSLVYTFGVPRWIAEDTAESVPNYQNLDEFVANGCSSTLTLDADKGDLVWDRPCIPGLYNIAIVVYEYRNGQLIGFITRDMQINVVDLKNDPPKLEIPSDTCVTAGALVNGTITGTDAFGSQLNLFAYSGVFSLRTSPATTKLQFPPQPQYSPAKMFFTWQTRCEHVRQESYDIIFKAEDEPFTNNKLTDEKTWSIKVIAPKPVGLRATTKNKSITLHWNKYSCSNAVRMIIMRKSCPSDSSTTDSCTTGFQGTSQFEKIAEVKATDTSYIDEKGLKRGVVYCYRIYAEFPEPNKGQSRPSNELCVTLSIDVPIIFKVSVDTIDGTSKTNGKIIVAWTKPKYIDSTLYPPPYSYELWRINTKPTTEVSKVNATFTFNDTSFVDTGLDTETKKYDYYVRFYYGPSKLVREDTDTASSVFLEGFSKNRKSILRWTYSVPWNNDGKYHYVWRKIDSTFELIDSVLLNGVEGSYTDNGNYKNIKLTNGQSYTYYISTQGDYTCPDNVRRVNIPNLLRNNSQWITVIPSDTNKPCPPVARMIRSECNNSQPTVPIVYWQPQLNIYCDSAIVSYKIYHAEENKEEFNLIDTKPWGDTMYVHQNNTSPNGCYYIIAVNKEGKESVKSNEVCSEFNTEKCAFFELPNVFTPNNDGVNDNFEPMPFSQFVDKLDINIYNRWGTKVFSSDDVNFKWDGVGSTDGLYYYIANVYFKTTSIDLKKEERKGWIQLIR